VPLLAGFAKAGGRLAWDLHFWTTRADADHPGTRATLRADECPDFLEILLERYFLSVSTLASHWHLVRTLRQHHRGVW
jgi:hypothetical protein